MAPMPGQVANADLAYVYSRLLPDEAEARRCDALKYTSSAIMCAPAARPGRAAGAAGAAGRARARRAATVCFCCCCCCCCFCSSSSSSSSSQRLDTRCDEVNSYAAAAVQVLLGARLHVPRARNAQHVPRVRLPRLLRRDLRAAPPAGRAVLLHPLPRADRPVRCAQRSRSCCARSRVRAVSRCVCVCVCVCVAPERGARWQGKTR